MSIHHLIFDCDGVLVDSEIVATRIALDMLAEYGYHNEVLPFASRFAGQLSKDIIATLKVEEQLALPEDFVEQLYAKFEADFEALLKPVPGMPELIQTLALPKNVVSNGRGDHVKRSLKVTGLEAHFGEEIFSVERVENAKPAPDLYLLALSRLGLAAEHVLVVEDSETGVQAAKAAGLKVIGFTGASHLELPHGEKLTAKGADYVAADAAALKDIFAQLLNKN